MNIQLSGDSLRSLLLDIQKKYDEDNNNLDILCIYSKSALLEFSGWIEERNDELVFNYINDKLDESFKEKLIRKISGIHSFKYEKFEQLLVLAIGYVNFQKIISEPAINTEFEHFKRTLNSLGKIRDAAAHTHRKLPQNLNAPNSHLPDLNFLITMFLHFEENLQRLT
jgi:hypothetical protein